MRIAPLQSFGLGDVIFCQTLANMWLKDGHSVIWGVEPQYVEGLNRAYPNVKFVDYTSLPIDYNRKDEHDSNGYRVIPLRWSDSICRVPYDRCMESKYILFKLHFSIWRDGAIWQRDTAKERQVFEVLGLNIGEKYAVVNETYQTDFKGNSKIVPAFDGRIVKMRMLQGASLFDWALVLERATEIHTVSTSLIYILEMMNLQCPIHLYPRATDPHFNQIKYIFTKPYILH